MRADGSMLSRALVVVVLFAAVALFAAPVPAGAYEPPYPGCEQWIGYTKAEYLECGSNPWGSANTKGGADTIRGRGGVDILFGGNNADEIFAGPGADNIFGGDFCRETGYWGFQERADREGWPDLSDRECNVGPNEADRLHGGDGDDWIWESNSDNYSDGYEDLIWCGAGYDIAAVGEEDTIVVPGDCEVVHVLPVNPSL